LVKRVEKISDKIVIKKKSKEEAFREFQDRSDYNLEILDSTPFPNTINISHVAIDEYAELDKIITAKSFVLDTTDNA
jgi:cell division protein FtsX